MTLNIYFKERTRNNWQVGEAEGCRVLIVYTINYGGSRDLTLFYLFHVGEQHMKKWSYGQQGHTRK